MQTDVKIKMSKCDRRNGKTSGNKIIFTNREKGRKGNVRKIYVDKKKDKGRLT